MSKTSAISKVKQAYKFIESHSGEFNVTTMYRVLCIQRSGHYAWLQHPIFDRAQEDARLLKLIRVSFTASHGIYGAPRVLQDLCERGGTCSKHRVARLMRENSLRALHGYRIRHILISKRAALIPNLLQRQFTASRPNEAWVTDITYIRTWQGWLYLAVAMDLFARKVVGWAVRPTIHRELVLDAFAQAVRNRRPRNALIQSDQGTQYGSDGWRRFCKADHLEPSVSGRGNCWDNAVAESFFGGLKKERIKKRIYADGKPPRLIWPNTSIVSTIQYGGIAILAVSARTSLERRIASGNQVSIESW